MLCDRCKKRPATMKKIQVVNYNKREINLCNECAMEVGFINNNFSSLFSTLMSMDGLYSDKNIHEKKCPVCGASLNTFNKTGKLGCSECYSAFLDEVRPLLRKIHGNCMHKGSAPYIVENHNNSAVIENISNKDRDILELKNEMQNAIVKEEFEKAAELRDKIKVLEEGE